MKDWKAECAQLRGQLKEVERQRDYYQNGLRHRTERDEELQARLKELLIDILK